MMFLPSFFGSDQQKDQHQHHQQQSSQHQDHHQRACSPPSDFPLVNEQSVCASAPGKVILFGEHAVVYGEPAVAASLGDLCVCVLVTPTNHNTISTSTSTRTNATSTASTSNTTSTTSTSSTTDDHDDDHVGDHVGGLLRIDLPDLDIYIELPGTHLADPLLLQNIKTPPTLECAQAIGSILIQPLILQLQQKLDKKNTVMMGSPLSSPSSSSSSSPPPNNCIPNHDLMVSALTPLFYLLCVMLPDAETFFCGSSGSRRGGRGLDIQVKSHNLPVGAGLGSSAAFSTALAAALVQLTTKSTTATTDSSSPQPQQQSSSSSLLVGVGGSGNGLPDAPSLERIQEFAYYSEQLLHGTPSGIDNAVSAHGGAILFQRNNNNTTDNTDNDNPPKNNLAASSASNSLFQPLLPAAATTTTTTKSSDLTLSMLLPQHMVLVHTHIPRSTKRLVAHVREQANRHDPCVRTILRAMGEIATEFASTATSATQTASATTTTSVADADDDNDFQKNVNEKMRSLCSINSSTRFLELMTLNQHLLRAVGVSHPQIDEICKIVANVGGTARPSSDGDNNDDSVVTAAAKLTGAGGGGCVLVAYNDSTKGDSILRALKARFANLTFFRTQVGGPGVRWISVDEFLSLSSSSSLSAQQEHDLLVTRHYSEQKDDGNEKVSRCRTTRLRLRHGHERATTPGFAVVAAATVLLVLVGGGTLLAVSGASRYYLGRNTNRF